MILLTGGSGLLGRELRKHLEVFAPSHKEFDVTKEKTCPDFVHLIVHAAAYTDVAKAEDERDVAYGVNVLGTLNVAGMGKPLVYISTEYVFDGGRGNYAEDDAVNPVNCYARTKEIGERMARHAKRWLIIRTLFKPRPFEHPRALTDQMTSGDYVDVIAPMIAKAVKAFDAGKISGVLHIGTGRKSTYDLARQSRDVEKATLSQMPVRLPRDTSLSTSKWTSLGL